MLANVRGMCGIGLVSAWVFGAAALLTAPARAQDETAQFTMEIEITWSAETAPFEFPTAAHMSRLIGATHHRKYVLFSDGDTASSGLELVAENGRDTTLRAEFAEAQRRRRIGSIIAGPGLASVPGSLHINFETTARHPLLSFVAMIAPSPDWFTGTADVALMRDGAWIEGADLRLWAWDSGTDSGTTYAAADDDTQPQQSVRLVASRHFLSKDGLVAVGVARLRRVRP